MRARWPEPATGSAEAGVKQLFNGYFVAIILCYFAENEMIPFIGFKSLKLSVAQM